MPGSPVSDATLVGVGNSLEARLVRLLQRRKLGIGLAGLAVCLAVPSLFLGFYLDDYILRYAYSDLEGARRLYQVLAGGYSLANGNPAESHWQIEHGWAPWWIYPTLRMTMFRPLGLATHLLDARLWLSSAAAMRVHSLFWLALLVLATTRLYRGVLGTLVGGLAALLFAVDHTHGFEVGYICNRHALVAATFGILSLDQFVRSRAHAWKWGITLGPFLYLLGLLSSESSVAIVGYVMSHAIFAEKGPPLRRAASIAPYLAITVVWRVAYNVAGYGSVGSGLYLDPARQPGRFLPALLERGPLLLLGQFLAPPAELYQIVSPTVAHALLVGAVLFAILLSAAFVPLLRRDSIARFWAAGLLFSIIPASATYSHNRQLLMTSFGAMGLIAQIWNLYAITLRDLALTTLGKLSKTVGALVFATHLVLSPLAMLFTVCGIALSAPLHRSISDVGPEIEGRDAVFVTAPDYFSVKLIQLSRRIERQPLPRRWRALSFGPEPVVVHRIDAQTLRLDYVGGILGTPFLELYRDRKLSMAPGDHVLLEGLTIEVRDVTADGRATSATFAFDTPLESPSFLFYYWENGHFKVFSPPPVGSSRTLPGATIPWGFE
jgi:hypothetical protein